jgi:hypothetical protein
MSDDTLLYPTIPVLTGDMLLFPHWPPTTTAQNYISLAQLAAFVGGMAPEFLTMTGSGALPAGAVGTVIVRNATGAAITITLPTGPVVGQSLLIKDALGNAGTYPITIGGSMAVVMADNGEVAVDDRGNVVTRSTPTINGNPSYTLVSDYASVEVLWMGDQWGTR